MAPLDTAFAEIGRAEDQAAEIVQAARLNFGRKIREMRAQGIKQVAIARHFGWDREYVRRLQEAADIADGLKPDPKGSSDS
jgi:hypothetical protein